MSTTLQVIHQTRVEDILQRHRELAERISLALDPDLIDDSDIDATTLKSLQDQLDTLKSRTETNQIRDHLTRYGVADDIRNGFLVMSEQLKSRRLVIDPNYEPEPEFPLALLSSTPSRPVQHAQAGPSRIDRGQGGSRLGGTSGTARSNAGLDPASGPQRRPPSIREHRDQANTSPSRRTRLSIPSDCHTFDVVFLPFKSDRSIQLPDQALCAAQLCLQRLGLVFQVKLPRQGSVQKYFDCQIKSFCEDNGIVLTPGLESRAPVWTPMVVKKNGKKYPLEAEFLAPGDFTAQKLMDKPFNKLRNYISEDGANKVLLIAPVYGDLEGAVNLSNVETPQMKHYCLVSRLDAAIEERTGRCKSKCSSEVETGSSSRLGTGRTLA
ncbi:hypothetical protein B0H19DRAFT_1379236 [Mycena capillaripes]|nr:hypothetical protein B0H19DRAFT_1379236 [Mycena capillaripes]